MEPPIQTSRTMTPSFIEAVALVKGCPEPEEVLPILVDFGAVLGGSVLGPQRFQRSQRPSEKRFLTHSTSKLFLSLRGCLKKAF